MSSPGDESRRDEADIDESIDALALRVERAIAANRREQAAAELDPLDLSPLDHVRAVLSPQRRTDGSTPADRDADSSARRDDNP